MKDCVSCVHEYLSPMSDTCRECGIAMLNYEEAKPKPITEYDRLVRKSPEEMSEFIEKLTKGLIVPPGCPKAGCKSEYCQKCWLDWLRQEATNA